MKTFHFLLISLAFICLSACKQDGLAPNSNPPKLLWRALLSPDGALASTMPPVVGESVAVYSRTNISERKSPLQAFDLISGEQVWEWNQDHAYASTTLESNDVHHHHGGILGLSAGGPIYGIKLANGELLWEDATFPDGADRNVGIGDMVLHVVEEPMPEGYDDVHLGFWNLTTGKREIVHSIPREADFRSSVKTFVAKIREQDTLVFFTHSNYNPDRQESKSFLTGVNISQDTLLFQLSGDEFFGSLACFQNRLLAGTQKLGCYDIFTGKLHWQKEIPRGVRGPVIVSEAGQVLVYDGDLMGQKLQLFDVADGRRLWQSTPMSYSSWPIIHEQTIYATSGRELKALSLATGELLWSIPSPHAKEYSGVFFSPSLSIDRENNRLYASDYLYALCYEL